MNDTIQCGLWRHYQGDVCIVLGLVTHYQTRHTYVRYASDEYGVESIHPLRGYHGGGGPGDPSDPKGWLDEVEVDDETRGGPHDVLAGAFPDTKLVPRFTYIGPLPRNKKNKGR